ncbi:hypothetical protein BH20ACI2_BH20ACI2_12110 [soil metagenome]
MSPIFLTRAPRITIFAIALAAIMLSIFLAPISSTSNAASQDPQTARKSRPELPNYDIRDDKKAVDRLAEYRSAAKKTAVDAADIRESMVLGERELKRRIPTLEVEYNSQLQAPEIISPDPKREKAFLTKASGRKRSETLKSFLDENSALLGTRRANIARLKVVADSSNPEGNLAFVELKQEIKGVPVFRGEIRAGFKKSGEMLRVISNFAPGLEENEQSTDFGDPLAALNIAADNIGEPRSAQIAQESGYSIDGLKVVFGDDESAPTAEKIYFPTEAGIAVPAWQVLIWTPVNAYYVTVDANNGTVLWRKNITEHQTQPATYSVYTKPGAMLNVANSPFPFSPGPTAPNGLQGAPINRSTVVRVGNEPPYTFNQLGWITDGNTKTDGNNVQAGLDRDGTDGIDLNSEANNAGRNFTYDYNPFNPNNGIGDSPLGATFQQGAITQLFYITNWFHDETYRLGFTEAARNFQHVNFTGQGLGNDRIRAEAQDSSGTNNATFSSPGDGTRGRMQMFLWTNSNPNKDGGLDGDVVVHELAHGLSNRLHGNSTGLTNDMSRGMGEGWSDFFAMAMLSHPDDPLDSLYTMGAYVTANFVSLPSISANAYYGIRRFPTARMSSVGPNGKPYNPLTFGDIDITQFDLNDGAFAPRFSGTPDQVHNAGEIWCNILWEVRSRFITRLGWEVGNRRILQFVVDGMKLSPLSPTFVNARDAIIAAGVAGGTPADVADMWAGFAVRGLGAGASVQNPGGSSTGGTGTARVTQSFALPNLFQVENIQVSDASGDNDGFPEPGEIITLTVPLTNNTGNLATGVTLQVAGGSSASFGSLAGTSTTSRQVTYLVPTETLCGGLTSVTLNVNSSLGPVAFVRDIFIGKPGSTIPIENFDNVAAPAIPAGWTAEAISGGVNFVSSSAMPDTPPNSMFALDPLTVGGGTNLTSPAVAVTSPTATLSFRNNYNTEIDWDGGVLEISIAGGGFRDILAAGGSFQQNGYNRILGPGANNPLGGRSAWTGNSFGYLTTVVQFPPNTEGKLVQLRWRFGADDNTAAVGWHFDTISLVGAAFVTSFECSVPPPPSFANISGRIITPFGAGLRNANVSLNTGQGEPAKVLSSSLGYFQFDNVPVGSGYVVSVASKRYRFQSQQVNLTNNLTNLDFVGEE